MSSTSSTRKSQIGRPTERFSGARRVCRATLPSPLSQPSPSPRRKLKIFSPGVAWTPLVLAGVLSGAVLGGAAPAMVRADVFLLTNGGQVEGDLVNRDEAPRKHYVVKTAHGGQITLDRKLVANVVVRNDAERRYEELLPKMPLTVDGHWKMSEWCRERGLYAQREHHLTEILKLETDHQGARLALGYSKVEGEWTTQEQFYKKRGYIRYAGGWKLPQEIEMLEARGKFETAALEWKSKLQILRGKVGRKDGDRALAEIRGIQDPNAAPGLVVMLDKKGELPELRLLYVEVLGRLGSTPAVQSLLKHAVFDDDAKLRDKCIDQLERIKNPQFTTALTRLLKDDKNVVVNRAALALGKLGDPAATMPLIDALVTRHKQTINTGAGISPTFSADGGGGLTTGGGPKTIQSDLQNDAVLGALATLHPNVNFGYDKAAWKRWYADTHIPRATDLRRDE